MSSLWACVHSFSFSPFQRLSGSCTLYFDSYMYQKSKVLKMNFERHEGDAIYVCVVIGKLECLRVFFRSCDPQSSEHS